MPNNAINIINATTADDTASTLGKSGDNLSDILPSPRLNTIKIMGKRGNKNMRILGPSLASPHGKVKNIGIRFGRYVYTSPMITIISRI
jgi:hypothetical protein